jgi:hypothetical protein
MGCIALLSLLGVPGVEADQSRTTLFVGATVRPTARLDVTQPARIRIRPGDIDSGYLDIPDTGTMAIHGNARAVLLNLRPLGAPFEAVTIRGLGERIEFGTDGGSLVQRIADPARPVSLVLNYRLRLAPEATPGVYAWPLHFDVQPLP